jgi:ABC-type uncharacterized transport system involved in gliding motility auxiliary subunit
VILAIGLFFGINFLSEKVFDDILDLSWDLTTSQKYTFSDESTEFLDSLESKVTIYCLFEKNDKSNTLASYQDEINFIDKYDKYENVTVEYVDPEKNPNIISEIDPEGTQESLAYGYIVIKSDKRMKVVTVDALSSQTQDSTTGATTVSFDVESVVTNSINYVSKETVPKVYFVTGHGEKSKDSDLTYMSQYIDAWSYEAVDIDLLKEEPESNGVLFFVSPTNDLNESEVEKIQTFIEAGGKIVGLFGPVSNSKEFPNFDKVLDNFNLALEYDLVKEKSSDYYADDETFPVPEVASSDVTSILTQNSGRVILTNSRSIEILKNAKDNITTTAILTTTEEAVGEPYDNEESNINGPLNLGVISEDANTGAKCVIIGNSEFVEDTYLQRTNGIYIMYGAFYTWMADTTDELYIESNIPETINMSLTNLQVVFIRIGLILLIPIGILVAGLVIWAKRRHL